MIAVSSGSDFLTRVYARNIGIKKQYHSKEEINMSENEVKVIVFDNLRQRSNVVGEEYESVRVKIKPFNASNAKGVLRQICDMNEIKDIAISAANSTKMIMSSK